MSVKAMSWVWEHSRAKGSARLVLLALADHAGADGGDAYPSVGRLATRCGVSERTVHEALRILAELGEIVVDRNAGPRGVNRYHLTLTPAESAPPQNPHPRNVPRGPLQNPAVTPAESAPEPSRTVQEPPPSSSPEMRVPPSVWRKIAEEKLRVRKGDRPVVDETSWLDKTARNARSDHGERAEWIWHTYNCTESQLVSILLGGDRLLAVLPKRDAA